MWATLTNQKENCQFVLDGFAKARNQFADNPNIVEYFENLEQAFLKA